MSEIGGRWFSEISLIKYYPMELILFCIAIRSVYVQMLLTLINSINVLIIYICI